MSRAPNFPDHFFSIDFYDAAKHADDNRECIRLMGMAFLQKGLSVSEVAELVNVSNDAVHQWVAHFKQGGLERLKDQGGRGRKPAMAPDLHEKFKDAVIALQAEKENGRIVGRDIQSMSKERFGIDCHLNTVYKLMHRTGLSWVSGRITHHPKRPS
ncbi:helix-turn-helix domain-containing protein [Candidatus Sororendozoicomonas aggregata]|uniref:helix-turn-helix domain-containing protein n=1 Tax=Candidatus Sororendozoicomonas aggregata TaxID=3073239 RepID=UPI002ED66C9D